MIYFFYICLFFLFLFFNLVATSKRWFCLASFYYYHLLVLLQCTFSARLCLNWCVNGVWNAKRSKLCATIDCSAGPVAISVNVVATHPLGNEKFSICIDLFIYLFLPNLQTFFSYFVSILASYTFRSEWRSSHFHCFNFI